MSSSSANPVPPGSEGAIRPAPRTFSGLAVAAIAVVWVALLAALAARTGGTLEGLAIVAGAAAILAALLLVDRRDRQRRPASEDPGSAPPSRTRRIVLASMIAGADLLFSTLLLVLGRGPGAPFPGAGAAAQQLWLAPGFLIAVGAEIAVLAALSVGRIDYRLRTLLAAQAATVLLSPTLLGIAAWDRVAALVGAAVVIAMFVVALQFLYRTKQIAPAVSRYLVAWSAAAGLIAAGWFLWDLDGVGVVLALGVAVELATAFGTAIVLPPENRGERVPWLLRPHWVFLFLLSTFLAEFFLGALLDLTIGGRGFLEYIPFAPPRGSGGAVAQALTYNGLWFAAAILASAWFLVALGFTMGPLVVLKMRETRERPQRVRLGLTVGFFALAAIYLPSFTSSTPLMNVPALANLPVLGWGFGLRAGGPFEASISLAVLLMYLGVGVLTVLFGRKALCSVMCGAALMYQGTAIHEMRQFNQSSTVGRHFLGSQLSTAYVVMSGVAVVSLFAVSLLAFLRLLPAVQVANGQFDTAALPLPIELYFGGVWFVMFVSTPYIGTYNCATTGFCHWGALSLPFARVGFFRLKVKDRKVCAQCTTFDCAKACPVGLVDMPQHFRTTGEYRSSKCCGVGDCATACPYGNLYHHDVRMWLRRRFGRGAPAAPRGTPLPMVASSVSSPGPTLGATSGRE